MKKTYTKPEIDITAFATEDIMTTSIVGINTNDDVVGKPQEVNVSDESKWLDV